MSDKSKMGPAALEHAAAKQSGAVKRAAQIGFESGALALAEHCEKEAVLQFPELELSKMMVPLSVIHDYIGKKK